MMKPSVPERGLVVALDGDIAKVMLQGGEACRGCGQAKIGLCRSAGLSMIVTARNTLNANIGDTVIVGIDEAVRLKAYALAFMVPLFSFIGGAVLGVMAGPYLSIKGLDIISAFGGLVISSIISYRRLKSLDASSSLIVKSVLQ